jgi:hypothetical protein
MLGRPSVPRRIGTGMAAVTGISNLLSRQFQQHHLTSTDPVRDHRWHGPPTRPYPVPEYPPKPA